MFGFVVRMALCFVFMGSHKLGCILFLSDDDGACEMAHPTPCDAAYNISWAQGLY